MYGGIKVFPVFLQLVLFQRVISIRTEKTDPGSNPGVQKLFQLHQGKPRIGAKSFRHVFPGKQGTQSGISDCLCREKAFPEIRQELFQSKDKGKFALYRRVRKVRDKFVFLFPGFSHEIRDEQIHPHLFHMIYVQLRKTAADVIQEHIATADNTEFRRLVTVFVVVKQIGDPVEGDGGFAAPCDSLDDNIFERAVPDDQVLFLLDRCDDVAEHRLFVLGKVFYQQFVVCRNVIVIKAKQLPVRNIVGTFFLQIDRDSGGFRDIVGSLSDFIFVIDAGHRCTPVHHDYIRLVPGDSVFSDVAALLAAVSLVIIVDPAEIGFGEGCP